MLVPRSVILRCDEPRRMSGKPKSMIVQVSKSRLGCYHPFAGRGACHRAGHFGADPLAASSGRRGRARIDFSLLQQLTGYRLHILNRVTTWDYIESRRRFAGRQTERCAHDIRRRQKGAIHGCRAERAKWQTWSIPLKRNCRPTFRIRCVLRRLYCGHYSLRCCWC